MKTPVIIPAYDEAERIGTSLAGLDNSKVEPFVVVNGEAGREETAEEARRYTSNVFVNPEQGKLPAVQLALRKLIDYNPDAYAEPIVMTDADTQPLRPHLWSDELSKAVAGDIPRSAAGPVYFNDGPRIDLVVRNTRRFFFVLQQLNTYRAALGSNLVMNLASDKALIEEVLTMPHIWPSEDRYLMQKVSDYDPGRYTQLTSFGSAVLTSVRSFPPLTDKFKATPKARTARATKIYQDRRAGGATHYYSDDDVLHKYE